MADLDGDGIPDLVSGSYYPGDIYFFRGLGKGAYAPGVKLQLADGKKALAGLASAVALADWNRDGKVDLLVGNIQGEVWFLPNVSHDGHLAFGEKQVVFAGGTQIDVGGDAGPLVADWDGDGVPDLLVGADDGSVRFYRGTGKEGVPVLAKGVTLIPQLPKGGSRAVMCRVDPNTGRLILPSLDHPAIRPKLAVVDWNGDGKLDLLVGDAFSAEGPEPVLDDAQKRERDALQKESDAVSEEISRRFSHSESKARSDLGILSRAGEGSDAQQRIAEKADEALSKDEAYWALNKRANELGAKLRPLTAEFSIHGFVWVYLRTTTP